MRAATDREEVARFDESAKKIDSVGKMTRECIDRNYEKTRRKTKNMRQKLMDRYGRLISFSSTARKAIKADTIEYIKKVNSLDLRLRKVADELFVSAYRELKET